MAQPDFLAQLGFPWEHYLIKSQIFPSFLGVNDPDRHLTGQGLHLHRSVAVGELDTDAAKSRPAKEPEGYQLSASLACVGCKMTEDGLTNV